MRSPYTIIEQPLLTEKNVNHSEQGKYVFRVARDANKVQIKKEIEQLYGILGLRRLFLDLPTDFRIYDVAHQLGMSSEQEYELLEADTEAERQTLALRHLERILPVLQETERLKERVRLNGHFKNLTPPSF